MLLFYMQRICVRIQMYPHQPESGEFSSFFASHPPPVKAIKVSCSGRGGVQEVTLKPLPLQFIKALVGEWPDGIWAEQGMQP